MKPYEQIMKDKDIGIAFEYLIQRARTVREYNMLNMMNEEWDLREYGQTVDTERHGHWIEELASQHGNTHDGRTWTKYKKYRCSYCGITNGNRRPDYCPHCGAKMDGVTE